MKVRILLPEPFLKRRVPRATGRRPVRQKFTPGQLRLVATPGSEPGGRWFDSNPRKWEIRMTKSECLRKRNRTASVRHSSFVLRHFPLRAYGPTERRRSCKPEIRVQLPVGPLKGEGIRDSEDSAFRGEMHSLRILNPLNSESSPPRDPVVQRRRRLAYTQATMVRVHPGSLISPRYANGRAARLKPERVQVRILLWASRRKHHGSVGNWQTTLA